MLTYESEKRPYRRMSDSEETLGYARSPLWLLNESQTEKLGPNPEFAALNRLGLAIA
jgi:hypothetical protein